MLRAKIFDNDGNLLHGSLDSSSSSAAEHFAGCVYMLVDLLNGAPNLNRMFDKIKGSISSEYAPQMAIPMFLSQLHKHPAFNPELVFKENDVNFELFKKIAGLLKVEIKDTSTHFYLLEILQQFKIDGIKSMKIESDFTKNQEMLYRIHFPERLIPEEYFCLLSNQIMSGACFDKRNPDQKFDRQKLLKAVTSTGKNPYTTLPIEESDIASDDKLQIKIDSFVMKASLIPQLFPDKYNELYQTFQSDLFGSLSVENFKMKLNAIHEESSEKKDMKGSSIRRGFFNSSPKKEWEPTDKFDFYKPSNH